jgi:hypothetical protein
LTVLSVVMSHYDGIDLPPVNQGFAAGRSAEEIDVLEQEAALVAKAMARLVSPEAVLQGLKEEK